MQWNIEFLISGAGGELWAPNSTNPVECEGIASLLVMLAENLPGGVLVETIGVKITPVQEREGYVTSNPMDV